MRFRSGLLIGIFGLIVVLLGGWFFTLATALLTYLALLELKKKGIDVLLDDIEENISNKLKNTIF